MGRREGYAVDLVGERMKAGNGGTKEHKNITICREEEKEIHLAIVRARLRSLDRSRGISTRHPNNAYC